MAAKDIRKPPKIAPGAEVTEALHAGLYMAQSDTFSISDTVPFLAFNVPKNTYIYDLIVNTQTAFADSGSGGTLLMAGYNGDSDAFGTDSDAIAASRSVRNWSTPGVKAGGYLTTGDKVVEISWATTCSVGGGQALLIFKPYGDENFVHNP